MPAQSTDLGRRRGHRTWGQRFVLLLNAAMVGLSLTLAWVLHLSYEQVSGIERVELSGTLSVAPGAEPGERVLNILLVGYDSSEGLDPDDPIQVGRQGERYGDVTIILHIDEKAGTAAMLSVPRDLWVPIEGYGDRRINYAFGIEGPELLIKTIETELDIEIHHYMSVDFAGFKGLVEAVGYVDVYFDQPARDWNETTHASQTGFEMLSTGCQPLDPPTALAYVRSRYYQVQDGDGQWADSWPPSDIGRIQRQQDFMNRLMSRAIEAGARNPFTLAELIDVGLEQITIDQELTPQLLLDLGAAYRSFDPGELETYSYPSDNERVNTAWVLLPLRDQAEAILEIFRGAPHDSPSTVFLRVVADPTRVDWASGLVDQLNDEGYELPAPTTEPSAEGIVLEHGVDGRGAAEVVEASLRASGVTEPIAFRLVAGNPVYDLEYQGRSVVLVIGTGPEDDSSSPKPDTLDGQDSAGETDGSETDGETESTTEPDFGGPVDPAQDHVSCG